MVNQQKMSGKVDLCSPVRNRYFYGKLLDVFHFELEQNYFNSKRWLMNRLVTGYGVVCGLNVQLTADNLNIVVTPGVAIDRCGHEIIVCEASEPVALPLPPTPPSDTGYLSAGASSAVAHNISSGGSPPAPAGSGGDGCDNGVYYYLSICYHECQTDPTPTFGGDCDTQGTCAPGSIRERYSLKLTEGKLCAAPIISRLQDVISGGNINYGALANYVTNSVCLTPPGDCCLCLANIRVPAAGQIYNASNIDITVRPIVYTNDLLYDLILASMSQAQSQARGGKP
jgi:hypothetical protein